ncbi:hypothetical protein TSOC_001214 [Tetrabaena socialis]|uniref:Uncharacterized protein n=1 Tax=Tetrabaena socialis TaxID=47790 RepID=A0A2J8AH95_9CHLO|nr:hypothetical protein TSOC_001214 [Tetrabaena socialis]|eukprot:PNH11889.1 hypothetical protein TSOC_001214 [Tetrabaena socialis]
MATILLPTEVAERLQEAYQEALEALEKAPAVPATIADKIPLSAAVAFADAQDGSGLQFIPSEPASDSTDPVGTLLVFVDPTGPHEAAAIIAAEKVKAWLNWAGLLSLAGGFVDLVFGGGAVRCRNPAGGFLEPDQSLFLRGRSQPNAIIEVAHAQTLDSLLRRLNLWASPRGPGPARVSLGVKIEYGEYGPPPPTIDVYLQLAGQQRPSGMVSCGAGSGCRAPCMYDHTLFLPVNELLFGAPWLTRVLVCLVLAALVPARSLVWGGMIAAWDVLQGRRSVLHVSSACVRSLFGPWWGVVPVDAFHIRKAMFSSLRMARRVREA